MVNDDVVAAIVGVTRRAMDHAPDQDSKIRALDNALDEVHGVITALRNTHLQPSLTGLTSINSWREIERQVVALRQHAQNSEERLFAAATR
ncbi:MAG: hypothetical protein M3Y74_02410 [Chloroflexota bacterium]|nr:hypothetical protein [Chloroflexota bacterium]